MTSQFTFPLSAPHGPSVKYMARETGQMISKPPPGLNNHIFLFQEVTLTVRLDFLLLQLKKNYLFIGCTGSTLLCILSLVVASRSYSLVVVPGLLSAWQLLLQNTGPRAHGL